MWRIVMLWPNSSAVRLDLQDGEYALGPSPDADFYAPFTGLLEATSQQVTLTERNGKALILGTGATTIQNTTITVSKAQDAKVQVTRSLVQQACRGGELRLSHPVLGEFKTSGHVLRIGTDASNDVVIDSQYGSKFHCEIYQDKGTLWVRDLDSKNGTRLDGRRVAVAELTPPAVLRVADQDFAISQALSVGETLVHQAQASHALYERLSSLDRPRKVLVLSGEPGTGRRFFARAWHDLHFGDTRPLHFRDATELELTEISTLQRHNATFVFTDLDLAGANLRQALRDIAESGQVQWLATSARHAFASQRGFTDLPVPPLSERLEDLPALAETFLTEASDKAGKTLSDATLLWLRHHASGCTARSLRQLMTKAAGIADARPIHPADLGLAPRGLVSAERDAILQALRTHGGNLKRTAQALGIARSTLYRKLEEHGLRT